MRVSDEALNTPDWEEWGVWFNAREGLTGRTTEGVPLDIYIDPRDALLDLRDARALLAWIEQQCRREYHSPEDLQRTILAELEGDNE